jgi:decaprenyl-phosphate phosphoribosyltransferase
LLKIRRPDYAVDLRALQDLRVLQALLVQIPIKYLIYFTMLKTKGLAQQTLPPVLDGNPVNGSINPYIQALRPRQWTKNLIVFAAPLFAFKLTAASIAESFVAILLFCGVSSTFYLINDILDVKSDRQHPVKCHRPIASGKISVATAWAMAAGLFITALYTSWSVNRYLGLAITAYALLQVAYNLKLKHVAILDIVAIAAGFVLRAYGGAAAAQVTLSAWFIICTAMLALFLGLEKRKAELRHIERSGRPSSRRVLQQYSLDLLGRMENVVTTVTLVSYILWSAGPQLNGASTSWMLLTVPFVLYGIFRYQLLSDPRIAEQRGVLQQGSKTERPEEVLLTDRPILLTVLAWAAMVTGILFLHHQGIV